MQATHNSAANIFFMTPPMMMISLPANRGREIVTAYQSGINANVHTMPPAGTLLVMKRPATLPPRPDSTVTYCLPLYVYVIGGALTDEPVLNCHSCLPLS